MRSFCLSFYLLPKLGLSSTSTTYCHELSRSHIAHWGQAKQWNENFKKNRVSAGMKVRFTGFLETSNAFVLNSPLSCRRASINISLISFPSAGSKQRKTNKSTCWEKPLSRYPIPLISFPLIRYVKIHPHSLSKGKSCNPRSFTKVICCILFASLLSPLPLNGQH